ncbi:MAG: hypothetical protein ACLT38_04745 [Akkermansia sp.]
MADIQLLAPVKARKPRKACAAAITPRRGASSRVLTAAAFQLRSARVKQADAAAGVAWSSWGSLWRAAAAA